MTAHPQSWSMSAPALGFAERMPLVPGPRFSDNTIPIETRPRGRRSGYCELSISQKYAALLSRSLPAERGRGPDES